MKQVKVALFDIDKTIIRRDSMLECLRFALRRHPRLILPELKALAFGMLYVAGRVDMDRMKEEYLAFVEPMDEEELLEFFDTRVRPLIFQDALAELRKRKAEGCIVLLVTASPECYMRYFSEFDGVDAVMGTRLEHDGVHYTREIIGGNCKGQAKVPRILDWLSERGLAIDREGSYAYSDSLSDTPMLSLVENAYLINYKKEHPVFSKVFWK